MNGLISWWTKNSVAANLLMVAIIAAGIFSFFKLEREVFPSATFNGATITVIWPGSSPVEVEEQVVLRIEEAIADIDGIDEVTSQANEGVASVTVVGLDSVDRTEFLNNIKNRVDGISTLPLSAEPPVVSQLRVEDAAMFIGIYGDLTPKELQRLGRELRDEVSQIPGGSPLVRILGKRKEEVSIEVSESALRRYGLTFDDVARAIRSSSLNIAAGQVRTESGSIQVAARALADTREEFEEIVVRQLANGATLRVRDVATVIDGFEDEKGKREINGRPSLTLQVVAPETLNIVELSRSVHNWVADKDEQYGERANVFVWFDFADVYFARMNLVSSNAFIGLVLVLIIMLLFLRPSVAFWVTVGIGASFLGAFIFMPIGWRVAEHAVALCILAGDRGGRR